MADEAKTEEKKEEAAQAQAEKAKAEAPSDGAEEAKEVEVPEKFKSLVETIEQLSALELSELVKVLEDKFGVSAAPTLAVGAPTSAEPGAGEEKDEYTVELAEAGPNKISVIKAVREISGKGLKESKDIVDAAPTVLKEGVPTAEAEELKAKIEEAGGKVNLK